jgi:hypothetical protein
MGWGWGARVAGGERVQAGLATRCRCTRAARARQLLRAGHQDRRCCCCSVYCRSRTGARRIRRAPFAAGRLPGPQRTSTSVLVLGVNTSVRQRLLWMYRSLLQSGMLSMRWRMPVFVGRYRPSPASEASSATCMISASSRNTIGARYRMAVARRLRQATRTAVGPGREEGLGEAPAGARGEGGSAGGGAARCGTRAKGALPGDARRGARWQLAGEDCQRPQRPHACKIRDCAVRGCGAASSGAAARWRRSARSHPGPRAAPPPPPTGGNAPLLLRLRALIVRVAHHSCTTAPRPAAAACGRRACPGGPPASSAGACSPPPSLRVPLRRGF